MDRRRFLLTSLAGAFAAPLATEARQPGKVYQIGVLSPLTAQMSAPLIEAFRQGLRELGHVEGKNVALEIRYADGRPERLPDLAAELVRLKVDVILAPNNPAIAAAQKATNTIPTIMGFATDPVALGFVTSLARPGGNITGLTFQFPELGGKRLQLLTDVVPTLSRVVVLWDPTEPGRRQEVSETEAAAQALGMRVQLLEAGSLDELDKALTAVPERVRARSSLGEAQCFSPTDRESPSTPHRVVSRPCVRQESTSRPTVSCLTA